MAEVQDFSDFGAHFLDQMLQVEMTEEEGVLNLEQNERELPQIPTFDLQTETFTYKDMGLFRNPMAAPPPLTPIPSNLLLPTGPPMITIPQGLFSPNTPTTIICSKPEAPRAINILSPAIQRVSIQNSAALSLDTQKKKLTFSLFSPEVKKVFEAAEPALGNLAFVCSEELKYYRAVFKDVTHVEYCKLHCTICDKHIGNSLKNEKVFKAHRMLHVLVCKSCYDFYGDGNFPSDASDNSEIYCRWCGQGGALVCCSFCSKVFCKKCVRQNYGKAFLLQIERAKDWACFCCAPRPLWPHRAICRALLESVSQKRLMTRNKDMKDTTSCCSTKKTKLVKLKPVESPLPPPVSVSLAVRNEPSRIAPKPKVNIAALGGVHLAINSKQPIYCGDTTITPPKRAVTLSGGSVRSPVATPSPVMTTTQAKPSPMLKLSVGETSAMEAAKIPTAKIPHNVNGLILRMNFPDNRVQLVRLVTEGNGCPAENTFPKLEFKKDGGFLMNTLEDSYKLTKMMHDRIRSLKEKADASTKTTEESTYGAVVKKLHFIYGKTRELLKEVDDDLTKEFEAWKASRVGNHVDVIDLSDEETSAKPTRSSHFETRARELMNDDSDVEIIEEEEEPLPKPLVNLVESSPENEWEKRKPKLRDCSVKLTKIDRMQKKRKRKNRRSTSWGPKSKRVARGKENGDGNVEENLDESGQGNAEENPEGKAEESPEGKAEESPEGNAEESPEGKAEESPEGKAEESPEGKAEENPEGSAEENPEDNSERNSEVNSEGNTEDNSEGGEVNSDDNGEEIDENSEENGEESVDPLADSENKEAESLKMIAETEDEVGCTLGEGAMDTETLHMTVDSD